MTPRLTCELTDAGFWRPGTVCGQRAGGRYAMQDTETFEVRAVAVCPDHVEEYEMEDWE